MLLEAGLNRFQLQLNGNLLARLQKEFSNWLDATERSIKAQLTSIPRHAREQWLNDRLRGHERRDPDNQAVRLLIDFLFQFAHRQLNDLRRLNTQNQKFRKTMSIVRSDREREQAILTYAKQLGATKSQINGDRRAFERWFDEEAVNDRYEKHRGETELLLCFVFDRLGVTLQGVVRIVKAIFHTETDENGEPKPADYLAKRIAGVWKRLSIEGRVLEALRYPGDPRVHAAALKCLRLAVGELPDGVGEDILDRPTLLWLHRVAIEGHSDVWVQCESLSIITFLSRSHATPILQSRIDKPREGDDFFVRQHVYKIAVENLLAGSELGLALPDVDREPSPLVRQKMAQVAILSTKGFALWQQLVGKDEETQVRGAAVLALSEFNFGLAETIERLEAVIKAMRTESAPFVIRVSLLVFVRLLDTAARNAAQDDSDLRMLRAFYAQRIVPIIQRLKSQHSEISVRRWAAQASEKLWAYSDDEATALLNDLAPVMQTIKPGKSKRLPRKRFQGIAKEKVGRVFAVLSQADFGFDIHWNWRGVHITRGPVFGFRLWRFLHEFRNTATDKRQALSHTVGRINSAAMRAPSQILGELSETKIPGEPLTIGDEGSWRPFIPLLDDFLSVLNASWFRQNATRFYTSQGITVVRAPVTVTQRFVAAYRLNWQFAKLAPLRNWNEDTYPANKYIESMRELGFEVSFQFYDQSTSDAAESNGGNPSSDEDESITRFFATACLFPMLMLGSFVDSARENFLRFSDYFSSAFENTIWHLLIFVLIVLALVLLKHFFSNYTFRKARRRIPISIGGWGTRGKSGTERLKAALIGATGHGLVSKTTGCEAMFIHGDAFGEPLEIPLFRPYDKATIWEQRDLIVTASKMGPSVFLWECMALTPAFVDVLQRQWTCDDLATITNTYPDHEDLQGPAGHNVATTISGFVPLNSRLITTEEVMRPYVTESCRRAKTSFRGVGWLESGLVTDDVLDRFPYKEHPDNVALVTAMGDELGIEPEFCLKAMGDYLVPDLGVLKTHPKSKVRTRTIEFTNGMSANERFGCMGNWRRLGFDTADPHDNPTTWVCGVVNNRADRVPRSKVFAKIIVEDMNADRFFLIGNNLKGLMGFIEEAWAEKASTLTLQDRGQPWRTEFALETLEQAAWSFRQPNAAKVIQDKLRCMLSETLSVVGIDNTEQIDEIVNHWEDPVSVQASLVGKNVPASLTDAIVKHLAELNEGLSEYDSMKESIRVASDSQAEEIQSQYIAMLREWYFRKLVLVENYDATGEEVVERLVDETPPGFLNRAIGLQNIKGTGLDFVYRFQAWDACYDACKAVENDEPGTAMKGLQALVSMPVIGQLCRARVDEVVANAQNRKVMQRTDLKTLLGQLQAKLSEDTDLPEGEVAAAKNAGETTVTKSEKNASIAELNQWVLNTAEEFLDVNDSLRRRTTADAIYRDLAAGRISRQRAVGELRKINKRQKGGWLTSWATGKR